MIAGQTQTFIAYFCNYVAFIHAGINGGIVMKDVVTLLGKNNLAKTPCRVEILRMLSEAGSAVSEQEIRQQLRHAYDRTTIYRTLRNFLAQGMIHSVSIEGQDIRYALSKKEGCHNGNVHMHFHCGRCARVYCLKEATFSKPELPLHFTANDYDLVINGVCGTCHQKD